MSLFIVPIVLYVIGGMLSSLYVTRRDVFFDYWKVRPFRGPLISLFVVYLAWPYILWIVYDYKRLP